MIFVEDVNVITAMYAELCTAIFAPQTHKVLRTSLHPTTASTSAMEMPRVPLYYASLEEAWYTPPIAGLDDVLVGAGWARVHWCEMEDWQDGAR